MTNPSSTATPPAADRVHSVVRDGYANIAQNAASGCCSRGASCCGSDPATSAQLARQLGYSLEDLQSLPNGANLGLSCGNPAALAALQPGEVIVDLGSGGGFDCFIAGRKIGPQGRAIGVDMTPDMLSLARKNIAAYRESSGLDNVEFRLGEIEHLPLADNSVDAILSNCVINLSPHKSQVWREIARVLKPGGRVAVSDIALLRPLPESLKTKVEAMVGCVAGAVEVQETERLARAAGLDNIVLTPKPDYVLAMESFKDPLYQEIASALPEGTTPADFLTSLEVRATKPVACCCGRPA